MALNGPTQSLSCPLSASVTFKLPPESSNIDEGASVHGMGKAVESLSIFVPCICIGLSAQSMLDQSELSTPVRNCPPSFTVATDNALFKLCVSVFLQTLFALSRCLREVIRAVFPLQEPGLN